MKRINSTLVLRPRRVFVIDNVMGGELGADSDRSSQAQRTHHASSTSANGLARALPDAIWSKPQRRCGADDPGDCIGRGKDRLLQATCRSGRTRTAPESSVPEKLVHAR